MDKTDDLIAQHGPFGVSGTPGVSPTRHVVKRRNGKTLCGRPAVSIFGIDLTSRRQITCLRCYKLAFTSVNAASTSTPDTPL